MKRIWSHLASVFVAGAAVSAVVPACAENDQTLFIRAALAPATTRTGGLCVYTDDPAQPFMSSATLDIGLTDSYFAFLMVANQLIPRGDPQNNRAESNRVHLNGAVVKINDANGGSVREFTSFASSFLDPQNNNTPDFSPIGLTIFDAPTRDIIAGELPTRAQRKTLLITIKVFGITTGGKDVESGDFTLPMEVCNGCLVSFVDANDPADLVQPNCKKPLAATSGTQSLGPCHIGQDIPLPCQSCIGLNPRCDPAQP
jgi:hypothetical protein